MGIWGDKDYSKIIGYGIGQYYEKTKEELSGSMRLDLLCDRKWDDSDQKEYDGIALVKRRDLKDFRNALVVIFAGNARVYDSIRNDLAGSEGLDHVHVDEVIGKNRWLSGKRLKKRYPDGRYEDARANKVCFDQSLPDRLTVSFSGSNNTLQIEKNVSVGELHIKFGNNGYCRIGAGTEINGAAFYVSDARIQIGKDCLFAPQVILRTHDAHHIFDVETHQRINHAKDIIIGDHVWLAYHTTLLGGAEIGTGSVVGTGAVTSSRFSDHVVIAGVPAAAIRENICWSRDDTAYFNRDCLEECVCQEAFKYI